MIFYLQMFIPNPLPLYCLPLQCTVYIMYEAAHPFSMQHCQPFHWGQTLLPVPCGFYTLSFLWGQTLLPCVFLHSDLSLGSNPATIRFLHRHSGLSSEAKPCCHLVFILVLPLSSNLIVIWFLYSVLSLRSVVFYTLYFLWSQLVFTPCPSSVLSPNPVVILFSHSVLPLTQSEAKPCCHFAFTLCPSALAIWFLHSYHWKYICSDRSNLFCADTWYFWENSIHVVSATAQLILQFMETYPLTSRRLANPFKGYCSNEFWLPRFENCQSMCTQPHTNSYKHTVTHTHACSGVCTCTYTRSVDDRETERDWERRGNSKQNEIINIINHKQTNTNWQKQTYSKDSSFPLIHVWTGHHLKNMMIEIIQKKGDLRLRQLP